MIRRFRLWLAIVALLPLASCFVENIRGRHCDTPLDCTEQGFGECDTRFHTCVPEGSDLSGGGGNGDMSMVACTTSDKCPATAPVCTSLQICGSCGATGMSSECLTRFPTTPLCGPNGGCVECLNKDNCDAVHKTCDTSTNSCVPCSTNGDCSSGLCNAGVCADKTSLVYVNNATGSACSDSGNGSFATPFCSVQKGFNAAAANAKQLVVFSGTYAENLQATTTLNAGNDYVVVATGLGSPAIKPNASGGALSITGTANKQVTVTLDGFVFDGSTLADGSGGILCAGGGAAYGKTVATITRSTIQGMSGQGVYFQSQCTLTLDSDIVSGNKGGGVHADATDFALTNLLMHDNGTGGASGTNYGGFYLSAAGETGKMKMFNLTVVSNSASTTAIASGMLCTAPPTTLANTLILGNQGPATEINATCQPSYSAFIGGTTSNNENIPLTGCALADLMVSPATGDFHPKKGGVKPCTLVDAGTNTGAPDHDLDGTARPQPASGTDDIGAYEAK